MATNGKTCFVSKLCHYMNLTEHEERALAQFEKDERPTATGAKVFEEGDVAAHLFVVKTGWLCHSRVTESGQRLVLQIRHPGDLCGMHEMMLARRTTTLQAMEESVVCPIPKQALRDLADEAPRVAMLIQSISTLDQVILIDTLQAVARTSAIDRVLHLLLQLLHRLRITNADMDAEMRLPMTQSDIGDMLGLTNVTVSKSMRELERRGHIAKSPGGISLLDLEQSILQTAFRNRFDEVELNWLSRPA